MVEWFGRPEIETDEVRERRITMEAVVDAYNEEERAVGWYYYLEGKLNFPFTRPLCYKKIHLSAEGGRRGRSDRHGSRRGLRARYVRRDGLG